MVFAIFTVLSFVLLPVSGTTQNIASWFESQRSVAQFTPIAPFLEAPAERSALVSEALNNPVLLRASSLDLASLRTAELPGILLQLPGIDGEVREIELLRVDILAPDFTAVASSGASADRPGLHYRGQLRDQPGTIAAISIFDDGMMGMFVDASGQTFQLGALENDPETYVVYNSKDLRTQMPLECGADEAALIPGDEDEPVVGDRGVGCKTVKIYFECDYKLYTDKGSNLNNAVNYVTGLFNQVATLYANDNVGVAISQVYVWTTPDPYQALTSTSAVLTAFRNTRGSNHNGNLAHFLSTRSLGGGIAYLDVICFKEYAHGVSAIAGSYQNVPVYSWSVEVVTHELGHNLGAWHTHSCSWPGGAIDNCYTPEGSCAPGQPPVNGGTIMSYCHLTGNGINFVHGFGTLPGNRIRDKVLNAACLTASGAPPTGLTTTGITATSAVLGWTAVPGATQYTIQYKISSLSTWQTVSTTSSTFNLSGLSASTSYQWQVKTDCSGYSTIASFATTGSGAAPCAAPVGLTVNSVGVISVQLSWASVAGASNYTLQYKPASSGTWITGGTTLSPSFNLSGLAANTAYHWRVKASCSDYSTISAFTTLSQGGGSGCTAPSNLNTTNITTSTARLAWSPVTGATSYTLQLRFASSTSYFTLGTVPVTSVTVSGLQAGQSYYWRVKANCSNVYSTPKFFTTAAGLNDPNVSAQPEISVLALYPNPADDEVLVQFAGEADEVRLLSITGAVVLNEQTSGASHRLSVGHLPAGLYVVQIYGQGVLLNSEKLAVVRR
ncbi:MAG: fibronectin type III domain-containing protein [Saprospiraceae bacterium]|nr:fibronectin type III domain-containing protein [Saprospiraceae bacterium]